MKKLIVLIALAGLSVPAMAATAQQEKMKTCNADAKAKGLKGDEFKKFRNECLKAKPEGAAAPAAAPPAEAKPAAAGKMTQQDKMKKCNADAKAKGLKGDEFKKFRNECLKG
jgi:hypothetical protein